MNSTILKSFKNFKYVFSSQVLVLAFGFLNALIVPSILSVNDFGYWQLYLFYASYVGVFALGFNDGIYLRYGSYEYEDLPHKRLRSSIRIHIIILLFFLFLVLSYSLFIEDSKKQFALILVSFNILILGINGVFIYILQITNNMKKYSFYSVLPKIILMFGILLLVLLKVTSFKFFVFFDVIGKSIVVISMIVYCKELWIGGNTNFKEAMNEYLSDVSIGIRLMLAQLMGMLVLGIGRFLVEWLGNIEDFAYYSFGITITNLILVMIASVSLLAYPTLKRLEEDKYPRYFEKTNSILQKFILIIPLFYFFVAIIIPKVLPKYITVLDYLNILFGVIMLQTKMQLLNNTFYKALREETAMMKANMSSVLFFIIIAPVFFLITDSIFSIALSTLFIMAWRSFASELFLRGVMGIKRYNGLYFEAIFIIAFVLTTSLLNWGSSFILYGAFLIFMGVKNRRGINNLAKIANLYKKGMFNNER
jgi:O-antigen/teichoic acid export membrane protein